MVWQITADELLARYADGERNFAGIQLVDFITISRKNHRIKKKSGNNFSIDLSNVVLRDINLRGAYFDQVHMIGADLTRADLGGIFLRYCSLSDGIVRNANLCAANVMGSAFVNTDLP